MEKKLKSQADRMNKTKNRISYSALCDRTAKASGFQKSDVKEVIDLFFVELKKEIKKKKSILLPGIGTIFSYLRPPKAVNYFPKAGSKDGMRTKMFDPTWVAKFSPTNDLKETLKTLKVTEEDINSLYEEE